MKKVVAFVILLLFAFNFGGYFVVFKIEQTIIRQGIKIQIKNGLPDDQLTLICVTAENKDQLQWQHSNEFRLNGIMYDVVKKDIIDSNTTIYHCVTDTQETILFAHLDEQVKKNKSGNNKSGKYLNELFKILQSIYPSENTDFVAFTYKIELFYFSREGCLSPNISILLPPPKKS